MEVLAQKIPQVGSLQQNPKRSELTRRLLVFGAIFLLGIDLLYKIVFGISYSNRQDCILYENLPHWGFLLYEYFVELLLVVIAGIFIAALIEKYFTRLRRLIPKNALTAFLYASVIPICSCGAVPVIKSMKDRIPFSAVMTFVVAAPLLNPYIMVMSFSVLGWRYGVVRIVSAMILAVTTGYIVEFFYKRMENVSLGIANGCTPNGTCNGRSRDVYDATFDIFKKVLPFMLIAGAMGFLVEMYTPVELLKSYNMRGHLSGTALTILVGVPVYFCNGADVLFLQPFLQYSKLPLGSAMAFSLTSTSVCITSLVLLVRYIGKKLTFILLTSIILITALLSVIIRLLPI
jgi:uncharacterized membrane protein YraQ (UPF0718 family)